MKGLYQWKNKYGSTLKIKSDFSIVDSLNRLRDNVVPNSVGCFLDLGLSKENRKSALVGKVTKDRVVLHRAQRGLYHSGRPIFVGRFIESDREVYLEGHFRPQLILKFAGIFTPLLFLAILGFVVFAIIEPSNTSCDKYMLQIALAVASSVVFLMQNISLAYIAEDIAWLENIIRSRL